MWASRAKLEALGRQEGRDAARDRRLPIHMSNPTHDRAADAAYLEARGVISRHDTQAAAETWIADHCYPRAHHAALIMGLWCVLPNDRRES